MEKYCAWDIEIATEIPDGTEDWRTLGPLGISCASAYHEDGYTALWHGDVSGAGIEERMDRERALLMLNFLAMQQFMHNRPVVTWNGIGFDFEVLLQESDCPAIIAPLALDHIDIGFAMLCDKGYMCGLNAAAQGMKVGEKLEGVSGKDAPTLWKKGLEEQHRVLEYVAEDARITGLVYEAVTEMGHLQWRAKKSGRLNTWKIPRGGIPTVREAMGRPVPDTSWMTDPSFWRRDKWTGWVLRLLEEQGAL
jgi:hypothetical protein